MAERLSGVIPNLNNKDQVGYVWGTNIATLKKDYWRRNQLFKQNKKTGYILAVDFQKTFDPISKDFYCIF